MNEREAVNMNEIKLEYISWKEVRGFTRIIHSVLIAYSKELEELMNEIVEGAKEVNEKNLLIYLDSLVQRKLLIKKEDAYVFTDAFRQVLLKHFIGVLEERLQESLRTKQKLFSKDFLAKDLLLRISFRLALELIWKEVGGFTRAIHSFLIAHREKELEELNKALKEIEEAEED